MMVRLCVTKECSEVGWKGFRKCRQCLQGNTPDKRGPSAKEQWQTIDVRVQDARDSIEAMKAWNQLQIIDYALDCMLVHRDWVLEDLRARDFIERDTETEEE